MGEDGSVECGSKPREEEIRRRIRKATVRRCNVSAEELGEVWREHSGPRELTCERETYSHFQICLLYAVVQVYGHTGEPQCRKMSADGVRVLWRATRIPGWRARDGREGDAETMP